MTTSLPTIIFFGNERLATGVTTEAPTLRSLIAAGYPIAAVVSNYAESKSRSTRELEIAEVATAHHIPMLLPERPADVTQQLKSYNADIGVLAAYGKIVPQSVIDVFPHGIINIHPSLLPLHRGPIPIESVIMEGAHETGVSIMQLVRAMDAGPVYGQRRVSLSRHESKQELADRLLGIGCELLLELLPSIIDDSIKPTAQDDSQATYDALITKEDGLLDWQKPAAQLECEVRAYSQWPRSRMTVESKDIVVTAAHVEPGSGEAGAIWRAPKQFGVYCSSDILVIDMLRPAGKPEMSAEAFLAGYGNLLN